MTSLTSVPVKPRAAYSGRLNTDRRGEIYQGDIVWDEDVVLFHSSDDKLRAFRPIETCFYHEFYAYGHVYAVRLAAGTPVARYPNYEVRWTLPEDAEIYYLGTIKPDYLHSQNPSFRTGLMKQIDNDPPLSWAEFEKILHQSR